MAKPSVDKFLDLLAQSGLVEPERLGSILRELNTEAESRPSTSGSAELAQRLVDAGLITDWQGEKLLEGRHKGFFLGKYRLLKHLRAGGMSNVYLAEHTLMERQVAIKVLPKNRVEQSSYLKRFHREAEAVASLNHENIVKAYDVDQEGLNYFLVMEYVHGRDLQVLVNQDGPLEYDKAAFYIRQAAEGLAHAHASGLIHRDMKPANLLVDERDVVKVLDLGLARFTDENRASLTVAYDENVLGTADYLSPEQAIDSHGVDARADIYSLGCSLYFLLTGHPPFPDGSLPQRLMMHQKNAPRSIFEERPGAPEGLVRICMKMIAKKPADRYQSATEVADVLGDWLKTYVPSDESEAGLIRPTSAEVDDDLLEALPIEDELTDSDSLRGADTVVGSVGGEDSASDPAPLPIADPAEDEPQRAEFMPDVVSPAVSRLRAQAHLTAKDVETYRQRGKTLPVWIWVVLGGCCLLTGVLALIHLLR